MTHNAAGLAVPLQLHVLHAVYFHTLLALNTLVQVTMLGSLSHPNIMRFMAISLDPPMIVMQYYSYGSLFSLLQVRMGRVQGQAHIYSGAHSNLPLHTTGSDRI